MYFFYISIDDEDSDNLGVREMFIVKRDVYDRWECIPDSLKKMKFDIIIVEE